MVHTILRAVNLIIVLSIVVVLGRPQTSIFGATAQDSRYFPATGYTVVGKFLRFFDKYGGLQVFGLPISDRTTESGHAVQYFERQRFEYHSEAVGTPNEVQLSRLGAELAPPAALARKSAPFSSKPNQIYFRETQHSLSYSFLDFWRANGSLRVLGYPISEPVDEKGLLVQFFERARMEYHPEKAARGYGVELGLLGRQFLTAHPEIAARLPGGSRTAAPSSRGEEPSAQADRTVLPPLSSLESALLQKINDARKAAGAGPVSVDNTIRSVALSRSRDMVDRNYFSHITPDGTDFLSLLKVANVSYRLAGEIITNNNYGESETAFQAYNNFLNSPDHRNIMLDARYTLAGVGEAANGRGFHYFTVIFVQK